MTSTARALLVGIEHYNDPQLPKRPGTHKAMRDLELRLKQGGWETRLLRDDASVLHERPGLTQILDSIEWLKQGAQALLVISAEVEEGRLLPYDVRSQFKQQSSLALNDLLPSLPPQSGLILDASVRADELQGVDWLLCASDSPPLPLFSEYGPTKFLHAVVITLNECPLTEELSVRRFFEAVERNEAPSVMFKNFSALDSMSLLTPLPKRELEETGEHLAIDLDNSLHGGRYLEQGRYQLLRVLGEGGIGTVYLAKDTTLNVKRAIKLLKLPDSLTDDQRAQIRGRMTQAAVAAQSLSARTHHVVHVFDIKDDPSTGLPFTVMEFLSGETLSHRLYRSPLNLDQVFEIGLTLTDTMGIAHELKVIHRDLKPENVMLINRDGTDLFVKLLDFDLVKLEASESQVQTQDGQVLGTLEYMAPEQLKGQVIDERADVFSLGAILYECFSGVRANPGRTQRELMKMLLDTGARPLREVAPRLPEPLCALIDCCLSLNADERPANARVLHRALKQLQAIRPTLSQMVFGEPVASPQPHEALTPDTLAPLSGSLEGERGSQPHGSQPHATLSHEEAFAETIAPYESQEAISAELISAAQPITPAVSGANVSGVSASARSALTPPPAQPAPPIDIKSQSTLAISRPKTSNVALKWGLIGAVAVVIISLTMTLLPPSHNASQEGSTQGGSTTGGAQSAEQVKPPPPPQPEATDLKQLELLEIASPTWESVSVQIEGGARRYQGGRLAEQLALWVYESHLQHLEGEPPLEAWSSSEALRWALTKRVSALTLKRDAKGLITSQAEFERQLSARPKRERLEPLGEVLSFPEGMLLLSALNGEPLCELAPGDLITGLSWTVRGYRKQNGRCAEPSCVKRLKRAQGYAKKRRARLELSVTAQRWPLEQRALTQPQELTTRCPLK